MFGVCRIFAALLIKSSLLQKKEFVGITLYVISFIKMAVYNYIIIMNIMCICSYISFAEVSKPSNSLQMIVIRLGS